VFAEAARMLDDLGDGTEKGHHPLTDKSHGGGGDLRDCTASEFRSHPEAKLDHRLIWRQHPAPHENALPIREAVHVGPRHETPGSYEQTLTIIERDPSEQIEANADYGDPAYTGNKSQAVRGSALDAQHAASLIARGVGAAREVPAVGGVRLRLTPYDGRPDPHVVGQQGRSGQVVRRDTPMAVDWEIYGKR
jgi:hypothetical protein